jgi:putative heme iron utilization protein
VGRGRALKQLLTEALVEARQYNTDEKTRAMLNKYPEIIIEAIAKECGITRKQFIRQYCPKATMILTAAFRGFMGRKLKSRTHWEDFK